MILHDVRNLEMTKTAIISWEQGVEVNTFSSSIRWWKTRSLWLALNNNCNW